MGEGSVVKVRRLQGGGGFWLKDQQPVPQRREHQLGKPPDSAAYLEPIDTRSVKDEVSREGRGQNQTKT